MCVLDARTVFQEGTQIMRQCTIVIMMTMTIPVQIPFAKSVLLVGGVKSQVSQKNQTVKIAMQEDTRPRLHRVQQIIAWAAVKVRTWILLALTKSPTAKLVQSVLYNKQQAGAAYCLPCPPGKHQHLDEGKETCLKCEIGRSNNITGNDQTECLLCPTKTVNRSKSFTTWKCWSASHIFVRRSYDLCRMYYW